MMNNSVEWYSSIIKPSFSPPSYLFGVVWGILYPIIFISFGYVVYLYIQKKIPFIVLLPFILNIIFNLLFSPLQFGLQSNLLAAIDITLVLGTLLWAMYLIFPYSNIITYVQVPYLLWVGFATILQYSITWLNR